MISLKGQSPIVLLDEPTPSFVQKTNKIKIFNLKLQIYREIITAEIAVKDCLAKLAVIVPLLRMLSVKINQAIHRQAIDNGLSIPCHKGCASCCYFLIPLSVPEALCLVGEIMLMPLAQYENLKRHWDRIGDQMREQLPKNLSPPYTNDISCSQLKKISNWYTLQKQPCSFLQKNVCTIYRQRPLVCRDFLVTGSSLQCQLGKVSTKATVKMFPTFIHVLRQLTNEFVQESQNIILLHNLFDWYAENHALYNRTWPAPMIVERFLDILMKGQQAKSTEIDSTLEEIRLRN